MVLWFSGTGNSEYVARQAAKQLGDELVSLNIKIKCGNTSIPAADRLIFCTPTNAWRIPRAVEAWIDEADFKAGTPAWFLMTCGSEIGDADKYLRALCARKGLKYMGVAQIIMPENYIAMFDAPPEDKAVEIVRIARRAINNALDCIAEAKPLPAPKVSFADKLKSGPINPVFYALFVKDKAFTVDGRCISCGNCVKNCPDNNIKLVSGKPVWQGNCIHCMACICRCPAQAIEYGKKSLGQPRYTCPAMDD